jgi:hypothetical protein
MGRRGRDRVGWATTHAVARLRTRHAQALGLEGFLRSV